MTDADPVQANLENSADSQYFNNNAAFQYKAPNPLLC